MYPHVFNMSLNLFFWVRVLDPAWATLVSIPRSDWLARGNGAAAATPACLPACLPATHSLPGATTAASADAAATDAGGGSSSGTPRSSGQGYSGWSEYLAYLRVRVIRISLGIARRR
eukprot:COSAG01_NODE_1687_length_9495_cov_2.856003_3_plen_117_part_00